MTTSVENLQEKRNIRDAYIQDLKNHVPPQFMKMKELGLISENTWEKITNVYDANLYIIADLVLADPLLAEYE